MFPSEGLERLVPGQDLWGWPLACVGSACHLGSQQASSAQIIIVEFCQRVDLSRLCVSPPFTSESTSLSGDHTTIFRKAGLGYAIK